MIALSCAIEVLNMANHLRGCREYSWTVITPSGEPVAANDGSTRVTGAAYCEAGTPDIIFVCGGSDADPHVDDHAVRLLHRMASDGVMIGGIVLGFLRTHCEAN